MNKLATLAAMSLATLTNTAIAADYIAVKVEAEKYTQKNSLWRVFSNSSRPNVNPDPDGSHHSSASGNAYLELLPDTRVTHGDPLRTGNNFWPVGGQGPSISYTVNFPESGRYTVWAKAYSTGTEDNGIHVGINGGNPESGQRMQWCGGKNNWTWSSAQRTNSNHCGTARTIYLDVPFAGANTVTFSAREDGFELDQFMLIKEKASGLKCAPAGNDNVSCNRNASGSTSNNQNTPPATPPTPAPDPTPEPEAPAADDGDQTANLSPEAYPDCTQASSDPDGDGYGWENGQSCIASTSGSTGNSAGSAHGFAICRSGDADEDNDGWGWENNQTCLVEGSAAMESLSPASANNTGGQTPVCNSAASDPDGDGWGWEDNRSCLVQ